MAEEDKKASFWTTLPGILTGIGGVVTAITALITGMNSLNNKPTSPSASASPSVTSTTPESRPPTNPQEIAPPSLPITTCPTVYGIFWLEKPGIWYLSPKGDGSALAWVNGGNGFYVRGSSTSPATFYPDAYRTGSAQKDTWLRITDTPFSICVDTKSSFVFGQYNSK